MATKHTCNGDRPPVFGRKTPGCARCDELLAGAAPVTWSRQAARFSDASTAAIGMAKSIMNQAFHLDTHAMAEFEAYAQTVCRSTEYHQQAVERFKTKQPARFDWERE